MTAALLTDVPVEPLLPANRGTRKDYYRKDAKLNGAVWHLNDQFKEYLFVDWRKLGINHRGLVEATADFMVDRILSSSASNVMGHYRAICKLQNLMAFQTWLNSPSGADRGDLDQEWFHEARATGKWNKGDLSHARRWFVFCSKQEGSGVSPAAGRALGRIAIGWNPKAVAVLTNDPKEGPLDDAETTALLQALLAARAERSIDIAGIAATWLCIILGPNPRHLAFLREEDFRRVDGRLCRAVTKPSTGASALC